MDAITYLNSRGFYLLWLLVSFVAMATRKAFRKWIVGCSEHMSDESVVK